MNSKQKTDNLENDWQAFTVFAREMASASQEAFRKIRISGNAQRSQVLTELAGLFETPIVQEKIILENKKDLDAAQKSNLSKALTERLTLSESRILDMAFSLREIAAMPDPVGEIISGKKLASGVDMIKKRVPLGVVFTIFESRPNVTVDIGALCIKSGNAAILRGGKEALYSNKILHSYFLQALQKTGLPESSLQLISNKDRAFMLACLKLDDLIDLVVPRGGEALIRFTSKNSRIPVVKHDKGVCNLFVDKDADFQKALDIATNAKLQRPSVCNAIENLLIHRDFPNTKMLIESLHKAGAILQGDEKIAKKYNQITAIHGSKLHDLYDTEFLDNRLAVKIVKDLAQGLDFIHTYGSGHSEIIVTENISTSQKFSQGVDTAAILINCSSRFHDGGQMGMGAEVGISTGRLHVRGPMGLGDLTTTTYIMSGNGQIRN